VKKEVKRIAHTLDFDDCINPPQKERFGGVHP